MNQVFDGSAKVGVLPKVLNKLYFGSNLLIDKPPEVWLSWLEVNLIHERIDLSIDFQV